MNKLIGLIALGLGSFFMFKNDGEAEAAIPTTEKTNELPRGIRNNNPGNIKKTEDVWQGSDGDDGEFVTFIEAEYGIRALTKLLNRYYHDHKLVTIHDIISRYAPESENDTGKYINFVADKMGKREDEVLKFPLDLMVLVEAIIIFENGYCPYSVSVLHDGLKLAGVYT